MNQMEYFHKLLNETSSDRFSMWKPYRDNITRLIEPFFPKEAQEESSLLVVGAGNCDDLDLVKLTHAFSKVNLTDIDTDHIEEGLTKQGILPESVRIIQSELTGLDHEHFFERIIKQVISCNTLLEVEKVIDQYLIKTHEYQYLPELNASQDLVIVSSIYTQLVIHQLFQMTAFLKQEAKNSQSLDLLESVMMGRIASVIDQVNKNIVKLLKPQGILVVISDIIEGKTTSDFIQNLNAHIAYPPEIEKIYEKYHSQYGYGLGDYGLYSMSQMVESLKSDWLIWPFDNEKSMLVKCVIFRKI